jgi:exodeoxyribonuclease VII small subunit
MAATRSTKKTIDTESVDFEASLKALNAIIEEMEAGKLSLSDSLTRFETGVGLIKRCQQALNDAEQKVTILTTKAE